ncbi:hypothetical protein GGR52DRAFT_573828 [Hypoxylon sp. FL1284]|nr:hypothetical protein GGR52DRAFT_573828 [Hypoxylon sp. FL1284]
MESLVPRSIALGILVEKEIAVQTVDNAGPDSDQDPMPVHRPSVVSIVQSASDLREARTTSEPEAKVPPRSAPLAPSSTTMARRPSFHEERLEALTDFFRSTPPPGNYMSVPDNLSVAPADRRWSVLKSFRKKPKNRKPRPPLITLPDSAISSRTSSGHRYIAISIPSEKTSSHPELPAQFPVTESMEAEFHRAVDARLEPIRSMTFDYGRKPLSLSTVDRESWSSSSLAPRSSIRPEVITKLTPPPRKVSLLSTVPSEDTPPGKGKGPDKRRPLEVITPNIAPISALGSLRTPYTGGGRSTSPRQDQGSQLGRPKAPELKGTETERVLRLVEISRTKRDERTSQDKPSARTADEPLSRNSIGKGSQRKPNKSPAPSPQTPSANWPTSLALPIRTSSKNAGTSTKASSDIGNNAAARSTAASRGLSPNKCGNIKELAAGQRSSFAESLVTTESSPKLCKAETAMAIQSVPIIVRPPSPSHQETDSPLNLNFPSPPSSRTSRFVPRGPLSPAAVAESSTSRKERVRERKQKDIERLKAQIRQNQSSGAYLRPNAAAEYQWPESPVLGRFTPVSSPLRASTTSKLPDLGPTKKRRGRSSSAPALHSSSSASPRGSPPWKGGSTAYLRRRERQAERDEHEARRVRHAAQALAEERETQERLSHQKLQRQYERLRESRARDMEERLRRLERNGEVLTQSLMSMMDTLHSIAQGQQSIQHSISARRRRYHHHHHHHNDPPPPQPERSQSLRSARSSDRPLETTHLRPPTRGRPASLLIPAREAGGGGMRGGEQEEGQWPHPSPYPRGGYASDSSALDSDEEGAHTIEVREPLLGELRETGSDDAHAEEALTSLSEGEVFNLF